VKIKINVISGKMQKKFLYISLTIEDDLNHNSYFFIVIVLKIETRNYTDNFCCLLILLK